MVLSEDTKNGLLKKHSDLCSTLNLDVQTVKNSWDTFQKINSNYTLEGDALHWLGCSIYVACFKAQTTTIEQSILEGNGINLTSLLRHCNLSIAQFFCNIRQWAKMAEMNDDFEKKINNLESEFAVTYNVFLTCCKLFFKLFKPLEPTEAEQLKQHRNRKQKPLPCTSWKAFEFCWNLFLTIKQKYFTNEHKSDLVYSSHVLESICDYAFKNAFVGGRKDLLNPDFEGLPSDWLSPTYQIPSKVPCVIDYLWKEDSTIVNTKYINDYQFNKFVKDLFKQGVLLFTDEDEQIGIFEPSVFEKNLKNITNAYETLLLNNGGLDERIFLAECRRRRILENCLNVSISEGNENAMETPVRPGTNAGNNCPTPLTCRHFLSPRNQSDNSGSALENLSKLLLTLNGCQPLPSEDLEKIFESCPINPKENIQKIVDESCEKLMKIIEQNDENKECVEHAKILFYKLIENVLQNDKNLHDNISAIVGKQLFFECIFACSVEIVFYAHSFSMKFPWTLDVLEVKPYDFIKVIELTIRSKVQLPRDVIKRLSMIEETILSSLMWTSDSPLWEYLEKTGEEIPKFEDTALPGQLSSESSESCLRRILNNEKSKQLQSPKISATDCFQSPITHLNSNVQRELFPTVQSGSQKQVHLVIRDSNGNGTLIPIIDSKSHKQIQFNMQSPPITLQQILADTPVKPRKTGGLFIIFRKFYYLSAERMDHLCTYLDIIDPEFKSKIWTVFEYSVRKMNLMKNRDLDQLLMCAIFAICRVTNNPRNFTDILRGYRMQPQATSNRMYRHVLLENKITEVIDGKMVERPEKRGDLIEFYNKIYIEDMKNFALKFKTDNSNPNVKSLLSPLPASRRQMALPSIQVMKNVFIKPFENSTTPVHGKSYNYYFNRSPSNDLKDINKVINTIGVTAKRLLGDGDDELPASKRITNRKFKSMIEERRNQSTE